MKKILLLILLGTILFSCSTTKTTTSNQPVDVSDKLVTVPEGKSVVYIVRPSFFSLAVPFTVSVDDSLIGSTVASKYLYDIVEPGKHTIASKSLENTDELTIETLAGKSYIIEQEVKMGIMFWRVKLVLIENEEIAKQKLSKCTLPDSFIKPE